MQASLTRPWPKTGPRLNVPDGLCLYAAGSPLRPYSRTTISKKVREPRAPPPPLMGLAHLRSRLWLYDEVGVARILCSPRKLKPFRPTLMTTSAERSSMLRHQPMKNMESPILRRHEIPFRYFHERFETQGDMRVEMPFRYLSVSIKASRMEV